VAHRSFTYSLADHDYCYEAFALSVRMRQKTEDLSEMGKILSNVALGLGDQHAYKSPGKALGVATGGEMGGAEEARRERKKKKKKKKHKRKRHEDEGEAER
jgi:hypothetical protein